MLSLSEINTILIEDDGYLISVNRGTDPWLRQ